MDCTSHPLRSSTALKIAVGVELFAFVGLWEAWNEPNGKALQTCSILTTTPNAVTAPMHDRMPVILDPRCYGLWLNPGTTHTTAISEFLKPSEARLMTCFPVSSRVNVTADDGAECSVPVEIVQ